MNTAYPGRDRPCVDGFAPLLDVSQQLRLPLWLLVRLASRGLALADGNFERFGPVYRDARGWFWARPDDVKTWIDARRDSIRAMVDRVCEADRRQAVSNL